jgi:hypothetical protein
MISSRTEKSNLSSSGSIISHVTQPNRVLMLVSAIFCQTGAMYSGDVSDEFWSSPPRIRKGFPLTMSCFDPPLVSTRWGMSMLAFSMLEVASPILTASLVFAPECR